jgi:hypothetical protein
MKPRKVTPEGDAADEGRHHCLKGPDLYPIAESIVRFTKSRFDSGVTFHANPR